ncbi:ScpA family protein [Streptomyces sp. DSM 110735]|uniref:segregation and condensation protein A n=1 Tax=Streptomyces sp. DSM 110735 TaxID=2775031 RepID=UPI0035A84B82
MAPSGGPRSASGAVAGSSVVASAGAASPSRGAAGSPAVPVGGAEPVSAAAAASVDAESAPEAVAGPRAAAPAREAAVGASAASAGGSEPGSGAAAGSFGVAAADVESAPASEDPEDGSVFRVRLDNFEGPFDLLLQLISRHKLDVTEVALSRVTDEFMGHIRAMGAEWDLDRTTEFLVVAATLLDLKAARLLPAAEVEDEADLALLEARDLLFARLLQYRAYKQIADIFNERLEDEGRRHPRTVGLEPHHAELLPEVVISIGPEGFARLAVKAMQPKAEPQVYVDHIHAPLVSVQEQAGIVVARLRELGEADFRALVADTDDTLTVVARFLALLELYREKAVALEQEAALGTLLVRWTGGESGAALRVTDEFDRPPEKVRDENAEELKT